MKLQGNKISPEEIESMLINGVEPEPPRERNVQIIFSNGSLPSHDDEWPSEEIKTNHNKIHRGIQPMIPISCLLNSK